MRYFRTSLLFLFLSLFLFVLFPSSINAYSFKGGGASFPALLFENMFEEYTKQKGHAVTYNVTGSGKGIELLKEGKLDFAVSEIPLPKPQRSYLHIPITIGAISVAYNLPGNPILKLTPTLLREIFSGVITYWDDKRLQQINNHIILPHMQINIIKRSSTSGTHYLFQNYLSVSKSNFLRSKKPITITRGTLVTSSSEMAKQVLDTAGSIGYISYQYAEKYNLTVSSLKNKSGNYVLPSLNTVLSASQTPNKKDAYSLIDSTNNLAYPICGISWMIFKRNFSQDTTLNHVKSFVNFIWWLSHEGQTFALENDFPPLPTHLMEDTTNKLKFVTYSGIILY